jgi:excisionase family DNA binding protein
MVERKYLTVKELAKLLRRTPGTVRNDLSQGRIPCVRILGRVLFDKGEIESWIKEQNENGATEETETS